MIDQVLNSIVTQMNTYIGTAEPEVVLGNVSLAEGSTDSTSQNLTDKVIASVINIKQEGTLRNLPFRKTISGMDGLLQGRQQQPEIYLNVYILFGANKSNYGIALQRVSQVISFFQRQFAFTPATFPSMGTLGLSKLVFDLYSTDFEELNQVWSIMGGKYIPSVIYKMSMAVIQDAEEQETGIISEVQLTTGLLTSLPE